MRTYLTAIGILFISVNQVSAQRACSSAEYLQNELRRNPSLADKLTQIENFIQHHRSSQSFNTGSRLQSVVFKIPVVVHILYHLPGENISDQQVFSQIEILNQCFRRNNADTANTPAVFQSRATDCEIEFQLATSDPRKRNTTGIIHKYTPIADWSANDQMKLSAQMGDDAWDANNYLNIWVCNVRKIAGYSSVPGCSPDIDGVVIDYSVFGKNNSAGYDLGRTAVHEIGHWLGLKHILG